MAVTGRIGGWYCLAHSAELSVVGPVVMCGDAPIPYCESER